MGVGPVDLGALTLHNWRYGLPDDVKNLEQPLVHYSQ